MVVGGLTKLGDETDGVVELLMFSPIPDEEELMKNFDQEAVLKFYSQTMLEEELVTENVQRWSLAFYREVYGWTGIERIEQGEVWRLITPIFLHFGWLHILFNLVWLYDLGGAVEMKKGTLFLALFIFVVALISCFGQWWMSGPFFGGMSGVVYGLFGYVWMKGRYQPQQGMGLAKNTIIIMMIWLVVCMTGAFGDIANTAHVIGLLVGVAFGAGPHFFKQWRRQVAAR